MFNVTDNLTQKRLFIVQQLNLARMIKLNPSGPILYKERSTSTHKDIKKLVDEHYNILPIIDHLINS